jgi:hypothetical protein
MLLSWFWRQKEDTSILSSLTMANTWRNHSKATVPFLTQRVAKFSSSVFWGLPLPHKGCTDFSLACPCFGPMRYLQVSMPDLWLMMSFRASCHIDVLIPPTFMLLVPLTLMGIYFCKDCHSPTEYKEHTLSSSWALQAMLWYPSLKSLV